MVIFCCIKKRDELPSRTVLGKKLLQKWPSKSCSDLVLLFVLVSSFELAALASASSGLARLDSASWSFGSGTCGLARAWFEFASPLAEFGSA